MTLDWWQLPGPNRYLRAAAQALRDGSHVVLYVPAHVRTDNLRASVQAVRTVPTWHALGVPNDTALAPVDRLFTRLVPNAPPTTLRNVRNLVGALAPQPRTVWLEGFHARTWSAWCTMLMEYAHASREIPVEQRTQMIVLLTGSLPPPVPDIALTVLPWHGYATELDLQLYAALQLPEQPIVGVKRRMVIAVLAALALWDPGVVDFFAQQSVQRILDPVPLLRQLATMRAWSTSSDAECWSVGARLPFPQELHTHSALLALHDEHKIIGQRIWSGQISTLFPVLEATRRQLLDELHGIVDVPHMTGYESITTREGLEFSHIKQQLHKHIHAGVPDARLRSQLEKVNALKKMRDTLAHFQQLTADEIFF